MVVFVFLSMLVLYGFIAYSIYRFGLQNSYSAYSTKWLSVVQLDNSDVWGVVTLLAALLMMPPMIEVGADKSMQFTGFFCPLYLIMVALTPHWESNRRQHKYHTAFALLCASMCLLWIVFVCGCWYVIIAPLIIFLALMWRTRRFDAYVFWGEMVMFTSAHLTLMSYL